MIQHPWVIALEGQIWHITVPHTRTLDDYRDLLGCLEDHYEKCPEPFGLIYEAQFKRSQPGFRAIIAAHIKQCTRHYESFCVGLAIVTTSAAVRGAGTALKWLLSATMPTELRFFSNLERANEWLLSTREGWKPRSC